MTRAIAVKTVGLSRKAALALLYPVAAAGLASVASWIITGNFNDAEIRTALSGAVLGLVALIGAWKGDPGTIDPQNPSVLKGSGWPWRGP